MAQLVVFDSKVVRYGQEYYVALKGNTWGYVPFGPVCRSIGSTIWGLEPQWFRPLSEDETDPLSRIDFLDRGMKTIKRVF